METLLTNQQRVEASSAKAQDRWWTDQPLLSGLIPPALVLLHCNEREASVASCFQWGKLASGSINKQFQFPIA
jgi:hypothetical protein